MTKTQKSLSPEIYGLYCSCDDCFEEYGARSDVRLRVQYVGQAMYGMRDRFREHFLNRARDKSLCAKWIRKHGPENLRQVLLQGTTLDRIDEDERQWIRNLNTFEDDSPGWGKNADRGGQGWLNREIAQSTREKHRATTTELWQDPEYVAKQGAALREALSSPEYAASRQAVFTDEWRARQAEKSRELWADPEWRQAWLISRCGPDYTGPRPKLPRGSQEHLDLLSQLTTDLWKNPEYRAKVLEAMNRPEVKQRQSELHREKWNRPGYREHHSAVIGEAWTEEKRQNQAAIQAANWEDPEYAARQREAMREGQHRYHHVNKPGARPKPGCSWCVEG